jgi:hypothetical protein
MPQYRSAATAEADALEAKADVASGESQANVQRADRYTLCVVLFAMALFFAGISTRLRTGATRLVALGIGWTAFLAAVVWMASFPVSVGL